MFNIVNSELTKYINENLKRGYPESQIKNVLLKQGYTSEDINNALIKIKTGNKFDISFFKKKWFLWLSLILFACFIIDLTNIVNFIFYGGPYTFRHYPILLSVIFQAIEIIFYIIMLPVVKLYWLLPLQHGSYFNRGACTIDNLFYAANGSFPRCMSVFLVNFLLLLIYIFIVSYLINLFLKKTTNETKIKIKKISKYFLYIFLILVVISLLSFGVFHLMQSSKEITLSENDIRIDSVEYTNPRSCSEIEETMKTSELARYDGYRTQTKINTWIDPKYGTEKLACMIIRDAESEEKINQLGRKFPTGWKTGLNPSMMLTSLNMNESYNLKFCCYLANYLDSKISNEVCSTKTVEKIC